MSDDARRLLCYDLLFKKPVSVETPADSKWVVRTETSKIDDTTNVFMSVDALEPVAGRYRNLVTPTIYLTCRENTTSIYIVFGGHFMSDHAGHGDVTFRIDDAPAFEKSLSVSTDNQALGLWRGGTAIPFIKQMLGRDVLLVRATPYSESSLTMEFPIAGLDEAIAPLREACNW